MSCIFEFNKLMSSLVDAIKKRAVDDNEEGERKNEKKRKRVEKKLIFILSLN
jgi:hypothetical protein